MNLVFHISEDGSEISLQNSTNYNSNGKRHVTNASRQAVGVSTLISTKLSPDFLGLKQNFFVNKLLCVKFHLHVLLSDAQRLSVFSSLDLTQHRVRLISILPKYLLRHHPQQELHLFKKIVA